MTALSSLSFTVSSTATWQATKAATGFANSLQNNNSPQKKVVLGTANSNATSGGSDELYASLVSVNASSNTTVNLSTLTDVVNQTGVSFARLKYWRLHLLSVGDDATNGTACTSVTVGGASAPFNFNLTSGSQFTIKNGEFTEWGTPSAAGYTLTSGSTDNIKVTNNDSSNAAKMLLVLVGGTT